MSLTSRPTNWHGHGHGNGDRTTTAKGWHAPARTRARRQQGQPPRCSVGSSVGDHTRPVVRRQRPCGCDVLVTGHRPPLAVLLCTSAVRGPANGHGPGKAMFGGVPTRWDRPNDGAGISPTRPWSVERSRSGSRPLQRVHRSTIHRPPTQGRGRTTTRRSRGRRERRRRRRRNRKGGFASLVRCKERQ